MSSKLLFAIASLIWGSTYWAITLQLGDVSPHVSPYVSIVYRFGLATTLLFVWCFFRADRLLLPWVQQRWLMLQGFASFSVCYSCTYASEQYLISALVAVLFSLIVIWTPIAEWIFFGAKLTLRIWCAALLAIGGVVLLFFRTILAGWDSLPATGNGHFLVGLALALTATIASTVGNLLVVKVRQQSPNVLLTMAWAMFWGTLWVAFWVAIMRPDGPIWRLPTAPSYWFSLAYLSVFGSVVAFAAYFILIDRIGAQKAVYVGVVSPIISVLLSIQFEHYRPGPAEWCGMVFCLSGVAWALRSEPKQTVISPSISINLPNKPELS